VHFCVNYVLLSLTPGSKPDSARLESLESAGPAEFGGPGDLEKVDRKSQFTRFQLRVRLEVPEGTRETKAHKLLEKAEESCLITNSLKAPSQLVAEVFVKAVAA
jgi:OsmC-like protein